MYEREASLGFVSGSSTTTPQKEAWRIVLFDWSAMDALGNSFSPLAFKTFLEPVASHILRGHPLKISDGPCHSDYAGLLELALAASLQSPGSKTATGPTSSYPDFRKKRDPVLGLIAVDDLLEEEPLPETLPVELGPLARNLPRDTVRRFHWMGCARASLSSPASPGATFRATLSFAVRLCTQTAPAPMAILRATQAQAILSLCAQTKAMNEDLIRRAHPCVQGVIREAGPVAINLVALECLLRNIGYEDVEVVRHLHQGFPLVGHIPVQHDAAPVQVRSAKLSADQLVAHAARVASGQLRFAGPEGLKGDVVDAQEVFDQTIQESISISRMSPLAPVLHHLDAPMPHVRPDDPASSASGLPRQAPIPDAGPQPIPMLSGWDGQVAPPSVPEAPQSLPPTCFHCCSASHVPPIQAGQLLSSRNLSPAAAFLQSHNLVCVAKRFAVRQLDSKGRLKLRCIDDFLQNRASDACSIRGRIRMDTLQDLYEVITLLDLAHTNARIEICKTDFKSAYRQCPVAPGHYPFAGFCIADPKSSQSYVATQYAMLFGAVAAVYAWDRVGAAVTAILRAYLGILVLRVVDDFF